ncbi:MAG: GGDEF domain-containing protein [Xanthomonadales bacterium]|nr:GGDEF domain-containing protein [Xanthomonadales bacterium]
MQLTATMTMLIGLALAFAVTGYPRSLQQPMRLWVRGLLIQPFSYALFSVRGAIPDWLSIVVGNVLLIVAFAHLIHALRVYNGRPDRSQWLIGLVGLTILGECTFTYVWPSLTSRVVFISLIIAALSLLGVAALYYRHKRVTRPEHIVATMLIASIVIMMVRVVAAPFAGVDDLTTSSILQGVVFTFASLMPVIATSGFLLMCGERLNEDLTRLATIDPLTGVFNRRTMTELANKEIAASKRHGRALSLLILDIDHFKRINDQFGHEVGDLALCRFVGLVREVMRETDTLARIGGEEFVLILPDTNASAAYTMAERIRKRLDETDFPVSGWPVSLRASIGVGTLGPQINHLESLLRATDHAMYDAKRGGRNRVVAATSQHVAPLENEDSAPQT